MKNYLLALIAFLPFLSSAQVDEDKLWEKARYEATTNQHTIYYTDVNNPQETFTENELLALKNNIFEKEGIVKVELVDMDRTFRIYHYEYIEVETIKHFVLPIKEGVEIMEQKRAHI